MKTQLVTMAAGTFHIYNNVFQNNSIKGVWTRGGGLCGIETGGYINDNVFKYNSINEESDHFRGAALAYKTANSELEITGNQFIENTSPITASDGTAALSIMDSYEHLVFISRNFFYKNVANVAGAVFIRRGYNLIMTNNIFWENSGRWGGAIEFYNPETDIYDPGSGKEYLPARLINNSFAYNTAVSEGGVLRFTGTHTPPVFFNCIFWGNTAPDGPDIFNNTDVKIVVSYSRINESDISGPWTGSDNIIDDPLFTSGDSVCHIFGGPCMDAGINELEIGSLTVEAPEIDFENTPRPQGVQWDIGADECLIVGIPKMINRENAFNLSVNPNPSSGALHLQYLISETGYLKCGVYSADGLLVKKLMEGKQQAGNHELHFDMSDFPDGIYLIRLQVGERVETTKVILLK